MLQDLNLGVASLKPSRQKASLTVNLRLRVRGRFHFDDLPETVQHRRKLGLAIGQQRPWIQSGLSLRDRRSELRIPRRSRSLSRDSLGGDLTRAAFRLT